MTIRKPWQIRCPSADAAHIMMIAGTGHRSCITTPEISATFGCNAAAATR